MDGFGEILSCDRGVFDLLGWHAMDLVGARSLDYIHPADKENLVTYWFEVLSRPDSSQLAHYRHRHADGSWMNVEVTITNPLDRKGWVETALTVLGCAEVAGSTQNTDQASEITSVVRSFQSGERLFRRLAEGLPLGVAYVNEAGRVIYANAYFNTALEVGNMETLDDLAASLDVKFPGQIGEVLHRVVGTDDEVPFTVSGPDGSDCMRSFEFSLRGLAENGEGPGGLVVCVEDVTDQLRVAKELEHRATTDALTGCLNRTAVLDVIDRELQSQSGSLVIFVDLDGMKTQNDLLGHARGDALLVETADRLRRALQPDDSIGRIGGDEFVAELLPLALQLGVDALPGMVRAAVFDELSMAIWLADPTGVG